MNIKKKNLVKIYNFLDKLELVGIESRARTKFNKDVYNSIEELEEDEKTLVREVGASADEKGHVTFANPEDSITFGKSQQELYEEEVIFEEKTMDQFDKLKEALIKYEKPLSGIEAGVYDLLLDELEK